MGVFGCFCVLISDQTGDVEKSDQMRSERTQIGNFKDSCDLEASNSKSSTEICVESPVFCWLSACLVKCGDTEMWRWKVYQ